MSETTKNRLYLMITITNRVMGATHFLDFYRAFGAPVVFTALGRGTASNDVLSYLGLEATEKSVMFSVVTPAVKEMLMRELVDTMRIDRPGSGIAACMHLSSVGGRTALDYLISGKPDAQPDMSVKEEDLMNESGYQLIVAITNTLILFTVIAVLGVSLQLYRNGQMGVEGVLICTLSALSSFGPVVALANLGASLTQVFASADRVLDLLDEEPVTADVTDGAHTAFAGAQAEHVSFSYADEEVLHDLSLTIPEKKIVGITGRSGSGKSTFLRLLMRFWDVNTGTIRFGEEDIRRVNTATLRAQESLVTQETELFNDTIENNIRIAKRDATREEVEAACKKAALDGFIRSLPKGYDTPVGELGGALSGGERQRIGVARAFLHDAPFLLLDEPTSNLDSLNEGVILKAVRAECRDKTVLLVSHRKSTMAAADVTYSVESGRLS